MIGRRLLGFALAAALLFAPAALEARSLDFDGSTGTVTFPPPQTGSASGITIMVWAQMDAVAVRATFAFDNAGNTFAFGIDNALSGGLRLDAGGAAGTAATLEIGRWQHAAVTYDSTRGAGLRARFYIDGVLQNVATDASAGVLGTPLNVVLGAAISTTLNGRMFSLKIFKAAMSQEQIEAEMRCARPQDTSSLVFFAPLDMGDKVVTDIVSGRAGTVNSGVSVSEATPPVELCGAGG